MSRNPPATDLLPSHASATVRKKLAAGNKRILPNSPSGGGVEYGDTPTLRRDRLEGAINPPDLVRTRNQRRVAVPLVAGDAGPHVAFIGIGRRRLDPPLGRLTSDFACSS